MFGPDNRNTGRRSIRLGNFIAILSVRHNKLYHTFAQRQNTAMPVTKAALEPVVQRERIIEGSKCRHRSHFWPFIQRLSTPKRVEWIDVASGVHSHQALKRDAALVFYWGRTVGFAIDIDMDKKALSRGRVLIISEQGDFVFDRA